MSLDKNNVLLSVIIPTYNRSATLARALDSVFGQTLFAAQSSKSIEVIVIDDGSDDDTAELINTHYPELVFLQLDANNGVSYARNRGIEAASGEWLAFLDSDDEWLDNKLELQFAAIQASGLQICHTDEIWIRNGVRVNQMNKHAKHGGWIFENCLPLCAMSPSSVMLHRDVITSHGMFDESLPACEDYDLWLRLTAFNEVAYVDQACLKKYGGHEDQLSRKFWGMDRFRVLALEKILSSPKLDPDKRQAAFETLTKKLAILKKGADKHQNHDLITWCKQKFEHWQIDA